MESKYTRKVGGSLRNKVSLRNAPKEYNKKDTKFIVVNGDHWCLGEECMPYGMY